MIEYIEKGSGLHKRITDAGHWLIHSDGAWTSSNDIVVQGIINEYTLDQSRAYKKAEISNFAKRLRDKVISLVSVGEMASWSIKLAEARKFAATGLEADAPMLAAEASSRGISLANMVSKVSGNAAYFASLEAQIGGTDGRHRDALDVLSTFESISTYDYSSGWPEM